MLQIAVERIPKGEIKSERDELIDGENCSEWELLAYGLDTPSGTFRGYLLQTDGVQQHIDSGYSYSGLNLMTVQPHRSECRVTEHYDTHVHEDQSHLLLDYLEDIVVYYPTVAEDLSKKIGDVILCASADDAYNNLHSQTHDYMTNDLHVPTSNLYFRTALAFATVKTGSHYRDVIYLFSQMRSKIEFSVSGSSRRFFHIIFNLINARRDRGFKVETLLICISYILSGSENGHNVIRDRVVQHMNNDIATKLQGYLNQNEYVNSTGISGDGIWATDAEVMATASLMGCDIVIHTKVADCMEWLRYPASFSLQKCSEKALYLENISEHFNVVLSV